MIRFQDEEVQINEVVFFKIEVPAFPSYQHYSFILYSELMCADISRIGGPPQEEDQLFKPVSLFRARISNAHTSLHEFLPITFDNHHFCLLNCTLHTTL